MARIITIIPQKNTGNSVAKRVYFFVIFFFNTAVLWSGCGLYPFEPESAKRTKIAYMSKGDLDYRHNIFTMFEDGTGQVQITTGMLGFGVGISSFVWSPDGRKITFVADSAPADGTEIHVINADGTGHRTVGSLSIPLGNNLVTGAFNADPAWSPDGTKIVFSKYGKRTNNIYIVNADGSDETQITDTPSFDINPAWSPDGLKIAFASKMDQSYDLNIMNSAGSHKTRLTYLDAEFLIPVWSPDGKRIAFTVWRGNLRELYVINSDGINLTGMTEEPGVSWLPVWSPDGSQIAFSSNMSGNYETYTIDADGSNLQNLTNHPADDGSPSWSPDGSKIVFVSNREDDVYIYIMDTDGRDVKKLARGRSPAWEPVIR